MKLIKYHRTTIECWKSQAWTILFGLLCFILGILFYKWMNTPVNEMISPLGDVSQIQVYANNPIEDVRADAEKAIEVWFEEEDWAWAKRVSFCESSWNPKAASKISSAKGLFQIISGTQKMIERNVGKTYDPYNAWDNAEMASWLFYNIGASQWECK